MKPTLAFYKHQAEYYKARFIAANRINGRLMRIIDDLRPRMTRWQWLKRWIK